MKTKRIISLILAICIAVGALLSMSSCLSAAKLIFGIGGEQSGDGDQDAPGVPDGDGADTDGVDDGTGLPAAPSSGNPEYLPDWAQNAENADKLKSINRALLSGVIIFSEFKVSHGGYSQISPDSSAGSGVIYKLDRESGDAYIITNYHVVYNKYSITDDGISDDISVYLYGFELETYAIPATYVGGSMNYDIAVLKIENSDVLRHSCAVAAVLGDSDKVHVFDEVFAVGNPEGYGFAVTEGDVSVESESLSMVGADGSTAISLRVMRVSAAINNGNSGGGLYDESGKLIGIVNAKRMGDDIDNIGYAIPINLAKNLADNILYHCDGVIKTSVYRCLLGVTLTAEITGLVIDPEAGEITKTEIVEVSKVESTCIIKDKIAVGDYINSITVDGEKRDVTRIHHVIDHMLTARVGSTVVLNVTRGDYTFDITVTIPDTALTAVE